MTKYSSSYDPPAVLAKVALKKVEGGERLRDVKMLVDTGSDITLLPKSDLLKLHFDPDKVETVSLIAFDGSIVQSETYFLQIDFLGQRFTGNYCAMDDPVGILGRDVLNKVSIILDGPNLEWDIVKV